MLENNMRQLPYIPKSYRVMKREIYEEYRVFLLSLFMYTATIEAENIYGSTASEL